MRLRSLNPPRFPPRPRQHGVRRWRQAYFEWYEREYVPVNGPNKRYRNHIQKEFDAIWAGDAEFSAVASAALEVAKREYEQRRARRKWGK